MNLIRQARQLVRRRRRAASSPDPPAARVAHPLLEALIGLAQAQIAALFDRASNLDTQAIGLITLDVALVALTVGARQSLGARWWIPLPGLTFSAIAGVSVMWLRQERFDLGPSPRDFYGQFKDAGDDQALAQLLSDLVATQERNREPLRLKTLRLFISLGLLVLTFLVSVPVIALQSKSHARRSTAQSVRER